MHVWTFEQILIVVVAEVEPFSNALFLLRFRARRRRIVEEVCSRTDAALHCASFLGLAAHSF
jgi:hypothetical protein